MLLGLIIPFVIYVIIEPDGFTDFFAGILNIDLERPETQPIDGDPSRFNPFASYESVAAFAGNGAQLTEITAQYVRADGTMDLNADYTPAPNTTYEFVREIPRPADAPPIGVAGTTDGAWYEIVTIRVYEPGQRRRVTRTSSSGNSTYFYTNEGMERTVSTPTTNIDPVLSPPSCAISRLWETAIARGAPADAVAIVDYDEDGYTFNITGVMVLRFNQECTLRG